MPNSRNASQFAFMPIAKFAKRLICEHIAPSALSVLLDLRVEPRGFEFLKPGAKSDKHFRWKLFHRFFDVFNGRHFITTPQI
jgi:hypothetical protein